MPGQSTPVAYRASLITNLNEHWFVKRRVIVDKEHGRELGDIRARTRDLVRNNPIAASAQNTICDYVAASGLTPTQADSGSIDIWNEWTENCNINGRSTWEDCYTDIVSAQAESGDVLIVTPNDPEAKGIKMRVDLIEADRIRTPLRLRSVTTGTRQVRNGVIYDKLNREIGYFVARIDPRTSTYREGGTEAYHEIQTRKNGRFNSRLLRRPSRMRPGQSRQLPLYVSIVQQLRDLDDFWDAAINRAKALSLLGLALETDEPADVRQGMGEDQTADATKHFDAFAQPTSLGNMLSGSVFTVPKGTKVIPIIPSGSMDIDVLLLRAMRIAGAAIGMPYELLMKDYSKTNFSSGKLSFDSFFRMVDKWNRGNASQVATQLFRLVMVSAFLNNDPRIPKLVPSALNAFWIGGARVDVDPNKTAQGQERKINNNLSTEEIELSKDGQDWRKVLESKARIIAEQHRLEDLNGLKRGELSRKTIDAGEKETDGQGNTGHEDEDEKGSGHEDEKDKDKK